MYATYDLIHDEIKKITFPEIAHAGPLGPCISIGIYDELSKSGYIAFSHDGPLNLIKQTIDVALNDFKDIKKLRVGVSGGNKSYSSGNLEDDKNSDELSEDMWCDLEKMISYYNFNKRKVKLHRVQERGKIQDLYLDCRNGKIIVEQSEEQMPNDYPLEDYMNGLDDAAFINVD